MKKVFAAILCLFVLCGCESREAELKQRIYDELDSLSTKLESPGSNRMKGYYSYYLPQGIKQRDANSLSEVFVKDGYRLIMNFDPSAVVIKNYYTKSEENEEDAKTAASMNQEQVAELTKVQMQEQDNKTLYTSNYMNADRELFPYTLQLIKSEGAYLVYLDGSLVKLYTYLPAAAVPSTLRSMYLLMTSISYDKDKVLNDFSLKSLTAAKKQNLDYLQSHLPSSGSLEELLNPKTEEGNGDVIKEEQSEKNNKQEEGK